MRKSSIVRTSVIAGAMAFAAHASTAHAQTKVATIYGAYDANGTSVLPSTVTSDPNIHTVHQSSTYDTPSLFFVNTSGYSIQNAMMVLTVNPLVNNNQNTLNNGQTQTVSLGTLDANAITQIVWGSGGRLFANDYDDTFGYQSGVSGQSAYLAGNSGSFNADCTLNQTTGPQAGGHPEWTPLCAPVGNFMVTFTGVLNNQNVAAVFGEYDVNNVYTGWQGLDPNGWSENTLYDVHSGTVSGVLANIYVGEAGSVPTSPLAPPTTVPEPATLGLFGLGLASLGMLRRRKTTK